MNIYEFIEISEYEKGVRSGLILNQHGALTGLTHWGSS